MPRTMYAISGVYMSCQTKGWHAVEGGLITAQREKTRELLDRVAPAYLVQGAQHLGHSPSS